MLELLRVGQMQRATAATLMNAESSRSHTIFVLECERVRLSDGTRTSGRLYLVDLAGSEKVSRTGAQGQTLSEAKTINKSLSGARS